LQSIDAFLRCIEFIATNCKEKDMREIEIDDDVSRLSRPRRSTGP